jgi:valine--pyruvate aminotransferase
MKLSKFGKKFTEHSGINELMIDLNDALNTGSEMLMLGGGAPAHIPEIDAMLRERMTNILNNEREYEAMVGDYDGPCGNMEFIKELAGLFSREFGFDIQPENIALTNGSQSAFFYLFNMFAGEFSNGKKKKVLFPLAPEYIGYSDIGLSEDFFIANKPEIKFLDDHTFKYHINFDSLEITDEVGAMCVSRPTNPTGNVLTNEEIDKLSKIAEKNNIPLIIDNAYGTPFPNMIYVDAAPVWNEQTIICMSLSKFGLPSSRTGIIIANTEIIKAVTQMNAIFNLAPGGIGPVIALELIRSGKIIKLSRDVVRPFYKRKMEKAVQLVKEEFEGINYYIHKPEGAMFLWLWFKDIPITCAELYEQLKRDGVLIVPGHYFYPGLNEKWKHKDECIRISYSQDDKIVEKGIKAIGKELKKVYNRAVPM